MRSLYHFLGGIKCAMLLIALTAAMVIAGTVIESRTGSHRYASLFTYSSPLFGVLLCLFFINILLSSLNRYPFKTKHIPFLITHLGLLMILAGAIIKNKYGVQGTMAILEGSASDTIFLTDTYAISVESRENKKEYVIPHDLLGTPLAYLKDQRTIWQRLFHRPLPSDETFPDLDIKLTAYFPHCKERWDSWIKGDALTLAGLPPIPLMETLTPFPVKIDRLWQVAAILAQDVQEAAWQGWQRFEKTKEPLLLFVRDPQEAVHLLAYGPEGQLHHEEFPTDALSSLIAFNYGYGGYATQASVPFLPILLETSLRARHQVKPPAKKLEENTPRVILTLRKEDKKAQISLAYDHYGTGIKWPTLDGEYLVRFQPQFQQLPYSVRLRDARQIPYPSTSQPYSYEADLIITDKAAGYQVAQTISMNHVYETHDGYRFYLANITPGEETAVQRAQIVVNYDPVKYWLTYPGACIMTLGILLLFFFWPYERQRQNI